MQTKYVASGDFQIISEGPPQSLVALLGTCVGVAIFDKKSKIGGICHILLPRPNDPDNVWQPRNYATTALPVFVDELLQAGANRKHLEAVVAGGALCTPISHRDIILDIGGQNLESALLFLKRHSIPVIHSEAGGCSPMSLIVHFPNCDALIEHTFPTKDVLSEQCPDSPPPSKEEIKQAVVETKPIPQIALKLTRIIQDGDYHLQDIVTELNSDQVMSAKVISYCNSAFFGFNKKIDSITKAVSLLGESYLLEAIISAAVNSFYEQEKNGGYALIKGGLYKHSLCVAHLARILSQKTGHEDQQTAYTAGLLHDIGKIVLDNFMSKTRPFFYSGIDDKLNNIIALEKNWFGFDHQSAGYSLASLWKFPPNLTETIRYHHHLPPESSTSPMLIRIVSVADTLSSYFMTGIKIDFANSDNLHHNTAALGLSKEDIPEIINQIPWTKIMYS